MLLEEIHFPYWLHKLLFVSVEFLMYLWKLYTCFPVKVAFMGCIVNGPGEAREADIGVAGGDGDGVIFKHGTPVMQVKMDEIVPTLVREICKMKEQKYD